MGVVAAPPTLAGDPDEKQAPPKDMGAVKPTKPQYDTGLKPKDEITPAEQLVFLDEHLSNLKATTTLNYGFVKQGSMEKGFADTVEESVAVDGKGKTVKAKFLSGLNNKEFAAIEGATSNPVILHFLERDLNEMKRLTTGQPNYFRKRIRLALAEGPEVKSVKFTYNGKPVDAKAIDARSGARLQVLRPMTQGMAPAMTAAAPAMPPAEEAQPSGAAAFVTSFVNALESPWYTASRARSSASAFDSASGTFRNCSSFFPDRFRIRPISCSADWYAPP
jgi:hypothetical protein